MTAPPDKAKVTIRFENGDLIAAYDADLVELLIEQPAMPSRSRWRSFFEAVSAVYDGMRGDHARVGRAIRAIRERG